MFTPNSLVSYKGGGYDGCFWEWNYAYIDRQGQFHDIFSSGYAGCDTLAKLKLAFKNRPRDFDVYEFPKDAERAADNLPISHLLGIVRLLPDDITLYPKCDDCGERFDAREGVGEDPHGIGGIMSEYRKLLCPEHAEEFSCT